MMKLNQRLTLFKNPVIRGMSIGKRSAPASLEVHAWHAGRILSDNITFQQMSQKEAVFSQSQDDFAIKISHASCEIKIDFLHPHLPKKLIDVAKSILISSEEYTLEKNGEILNLDIREAMLKKYQSMPLTNMHLYLSWYPSGLINNGSVMGSVPVEKITQIEEKLFPEVTESELWSPYIFGKFSAQLNSRDYDFKRTDNLTSVILYELDFESILQDLAKFIIFDCNGGVITAIEPKPESSYYMLDILRDHIAKNEGRFSKSDHVCSTLVARVLRSGLGIDWYKFSVEMATKKLGHGYAFPDLVFETATNAKKIEIDDQNKTEKHLTSKTSNR